MHKLITALLAIALAIPVMAFAQDQSTDQDNSKRQQQEDNQAAQDSMTGSNTMPHHTMTGMVSDNGKKFTSDNVEYQVANPSKLKQYDNQNVSIKFQFDSETNKIHVNSVQGQ
jgi:hypothetical protein